MTGARARHDAIIPPPPSVARFLLLALLVPALFAAASWWLDADQAATDARWALATTAYDRHGEVGNLVVRVAAAEAAQRGFVVTGDPMFSRRYAAAKADVAQVLAGLDTAFRDDQAQTALLGRLRALAAARFASMDEVMAARRERGREPAARLVNAERESRQMDAIRAVSKRMIALAERSRDARFAAHLRQVREGRRGLWIGVGILELGFLAVAALIWAQRLSRYRERLDFYQVAERNRAILDNTSDAIAILDRRGRIELVNPAALQMTGYDADELIGRDVLSFVDLKERPASFEEEVGLSGDALANGWLPDRRVIHKDGRVVPVDIALAVLPQVDGSRVIASLRDITERKRAERIKDELLSTVGHELRTPLTSVVGALALLRADAGEGIPPAAARLIGIAENNSRRLIRLINDMLDIDQLQAGQLQFEHDVIDLRDTIDRACQGSRGLSETVEVRIACDLPAHPVCVVGDDERLLQVLTNLIANAVNVSPPDGIVTIGVSTAESKAIVTVDDQGPGVPAEFRDRIFGRFERARESGGRGTGLGLAISREIVVRHGGGIWFEDLPRGTRFAFRLDLVPDDRLQPTTLPVGDHAAALPLILHLDDDQDMLDIVAAALGAQARIVQATTLAAARTAIAHERPAAAIIDPILASGASGLELLPLLTGADGVRLPTIVFTARNVDTSTAARVDEVVAKSRHSVADLQAAVWRALGERAEAA